MSVEVSLVCPRIIAEQDDTSKNDEAQLLNYAKPEAQFDKIQVTLLYFKPI